MQQAMLTNIVFKNHVGDEWHRIAELRGWIVDEYDLRNGAHPDLADDEVWGKLKANIICTRWLARLCVGRTSGPSKQMYEEGAQTSWLRSGDSVATSQLFYITWPLA